MSEKFNKAFQTLENGDEQVVFADFDMTETQATMIAKELSENSTTKFLNLRRVQDLGNHLSIITSVIKDHKHLAALRITYCNLGDEEAIEIGQVLAENNVLTHMNLEKNGFGNNGAIGIANELRRNRTVEYLNLSVNDIGDDGIISICEALKGNPSLLSLNFGWNHNVGDRGIREGVVAMLEENDVLERIWFGTLELEEDTKEELRRVWDEETKMVKREWSVERHRKYHLKFQDAVKEVLLMWNHDQYEDGECEGIRWNELPLEVVMNVIKWLGLYERELEDWKLKQLDEEWKERRKDQDQHSKHKLDDAVLCSV